VTVYRDVAAPRVGLMISLALFSHKPVTLNLMQVLCGIQMWRCGASNKVCINQIIL